ncbi:histidine phosphatase family protein [Benzoatithermus flavus]|uniref:Histidine phosphatase family protein n=1 Tax=Benzoatithermus flavus TaxID=3108223 RepID=A0ABU8XSC7_9PROT
MTVFYLVRHAAHARQGESLVGRTPGIGLGEAGRQQIAWLQRRFEGLTFAAVCCGPLERAVLTAEALAPQATIAPELDEVDYGDWTGRTIAALEGDPLWQAWNGFRAGTRIPGGETMLEVQLRAVRLIDRLREAHPEGRVLLVSHGDVIRAVLLHYLGLSADLFGRIEVDPGSLCVLAVEPWGARVLRLNEAAALP